jgi:hypothetical protein
MNMFLYWTDYKYKEVRSLKTKFHPSPYIVVKSYNTTILVKRLADGFMSVYSNDDIKKNIQLLALYSKTCHLKS